MKILSLIAGAVFGLTQAVSASTFGPLITPQELSASLERSQPIILDIRNSGYEDGHIAGAISAPYGKFRGPKTNPGQILEESTLEKLYESLGLNFDQPIVVVHEGKSATDFGAAARVYWTLKSSGFTDLTILNGGTIAWNKAGLPLQTGTNSPAPTDLEINFSYNWTVTTPEVAGFAAKTPESYEHCRNTPLCPTVLVDARTPEFYEGKRKHDAAAQPGSAPGAVNYVFSNFFDGESTEFNKSFDVEEVKSTLGITDGAEVVSYCNTGHWAAINWFAFSEIGGINNVKLYPGSMVEYSNAGSPMMNVPGLFKNLKNQLLGGG